MQARLLTRPVVWELLTHIRSRDNTSAECGGPSSAPRNYLEISSLLYVPGSKHCDPELTSGVGWGDRRSLVLLELDRAGSVIGLRF